MAELINSFPDEDDPEEIAIQRAVEEKRRRSRDESAAKSPVLASASLSFLPNPPALVLSPAAEPAAAAAGATPHSAPTTGSAPVAVPAASSTPIPMVPI